MNILNALIFILLLLRAIIGVRLLITAKQNHLPNLYWLAAYFLIQAAGLLFAPVGSNPLGNLPISLFFLVGLGSIAIQPLIIQFNQVTYYQNRQSPRLLFWIVFGISTAISLYGISISQSNTSQSPWVAAYSPSQALIWGWHGWLAYKALILVTKEYVIEDWIKSRYKLIIAYSLLLMLGTLASFIRILLTDESFATINALMGLFTLVLQIVGVPLQFFAWVMPENLRRWLNRNYQIRVKENVNEKATAILDIIGSSMSEGTGLSKMSALYAIRSAVGREIKSEDSHLIESSVIKYGYDEWLLLLQNPELQKSLHNFGANINVEDIIGRAKQALSEKQSLFTMQAK